MPGTLCRDCCQLASSIAEACPACGSMRVVAHEEIGELSIGHIDCDAFYASVEKRDRPELLPVPLIVGHAGGRGVVTTACYVARKFGVRSAMPMWKAIELCPQAHVLPPDMGKYKRVSGEIRAILALATDCIEPVSLDEAYLDLSQAHRKAGLPPARLLARIAQRIERDVRITVSIGLAPNKFLAKLASDMQKPRGFSVIGREEARRVLAPMRVGKIHGVGAATASRLEAAGIMTIGDLQRSSEMQLVIQHGRFGRRLAQFASGEDDRAVTPDRPTKSISAETTFDRDTGDSSELAAIAADLAERVAGRLLREGLAGGAVVLKLKTSDFRIVTRTRRLPHPTTRAALLLEAARPLIEKEADGRTFRLIGVGADALVPVAEADPPDLFSM
jgi:DNA polymerase-4